VVQASGPLAEEAREKGCGPELWHRVFERTTVSKKWRKFAWAKGGGSSE
jgi:hypothetical protein